MNFVCCRYNLIQHRQLIKYIHTPKTGFHPATKVWGGSMTSERMYMYVPNTKFYRGTHLWKHLSQKQVAVDHLCVCGVLLKSMV